MNDEYVKQKTPIDLTHCYEIKVGDKLYCPCNPYNKDICLELEKELNLHGFITKVGQNIDSKVWSVAIIGLYERHEEL